MIMTIKFKGFSTFLLSLLITAQARVQSSSNNQNVHSPYLEERRIAIEEINALVFNYCSQATMSACEESSLPLVSSSESERQGILYRNQENIGEYFSFIQGNCYAKLEAACKQESVSSPSDDQSFAKEKKQAEDWYSKNQALLAELKNCGDATDDQFRNACEKRVEEERRKNDQEFHKMNLYNFLNPKQKACLVHERVDHLTKLVTSLEQIISGLEYDKSNLLKFQKAKYIAHTIPEEIKPLFCQDTGKKDVYECISLSSNLELACHSGSNTFLKNCNSQDKSGCLSMDKLEDVFCQIGNAANATATASCSKSSDNNFLCKSRHNSSGSTRYCLDITQARCAVVEDKLLCVKDSAFTVNYAETCDG
jgi:hypothetical protein